MARNQDMSHTKGAQHKSRYLEVDYSVNMTARVLVKSAPGLIAHAEKLIDSLETPHICLQKIEIRLWKRRSD